MDSALMSVLTGSGVAGVFCLFFIFGWVIPKHVYDDKKAENAELKAENAQLRATAETSVTTNQATKDILAAIRYGHDLTSGHQP